MPDANRRPSRGPRAHRGTPAALWAALATALVVHGAVLGTVHAFNLTLVGQGFSATHGAAAAKATEPVDLATGCVSDAVLGSTFRYSLCFAPWHDDTDACLGAAATDMWIDLSACRAGQSPDAVASIAMLEPKQADKLRPIDPEPLIEAMREQEQPTPQPKVPELQPQPQPQAQQQPQPQQPPPPPPQRPQQVVETAKNNSEKEPENARFLSENNQVVEKQSVARGSVNEPMVAKSKPEELTPKEQPKEASVTQQDPDRAKGANRNAPDVPGTLSMRQPGVQMPSTTQQDQKVRGSTTGGPGPVALDGISPRKGDGAFEQQRKERSEIPKGQGGAGGGAPDVPNLKPSAETLERALGGGSVDHMDDVDAGDETALNSKKWIHASFFNRMKRLVRQNWRPETVWQRRDPTGSVYGSKSRVTKVGVSLTTTGAIAKIVVTQASGVQELDEEAVRAFQAAAPFVNTPKELAGKNGLITFEFGFYFEVGAPSSSWRVIRSY